MSISNLFGLCVGTQVLFMSVLVICIIYIAWWCWFLVSFQEQTLYNTLEVLVSF